MEIEKTKLQKLVVELGLKYDLPGLGVCLRRNNAEVYAAGYGIKDANTNSPVTADTMFGVASVTKILTAILIMQAQDKNLLDISDPVSKFFPNLICAGDQRMRIYHLLTHSAGFPGLPFRHFATPSNGPIEGELLLTADDLISAINALNPVMQSNPGEQVNYSNESFCLLGGLIEKLYRCSYSDAANRFVFQPLRMTRSAVLGAPNNLKNFAYPLLQKEKLFKAANFWDAPLFYSAGGLITSAPDMTKLIRVLTGDSTVLSAQAISDMISKQFTIASRPLNSSSYGLGVEIRKLERGRMLLWHTGQRPGISSFVGLLLPEGLTVSFVTNIADAPSELIGFRVLSEFSPLAAELIGPNSWIEPNKSFQINAPERFCGNYQSPEMGEHRVSLEQGELRLNLRERSYNFCFLGPNSGIVAEQTFCFLTSERPIYPSYEPTALALGLRILPKLALN